VRARRPTELTDAAGVGSDRRLVVGENDTQTNREGRASVSVLIQRVDSFHFISFRFNSFC
jgi:hypothetical protein